MNTIANTPPWAHHSGGRSLVEPESHRETDDGYERVAAILSDDLRVIVCARRLQYILQRRYADGLRGATWRAVGYFLTRTSLIRFCERLEALSGTTLVAPLAALPEKARAWRKN
jgi:hypothetical protein